MHFSLISFAEFQWRVRVQMNWQSPVFLFAVVLSVASAAGSSNFEELDQICLGLNLLGIRKKSLYPCSSIPEGSLCISRGSTLCIALGHLGFMEHSINNFDLKKMHIELKFTSYHREDKFHPCFYLLSFFVLKCCNYLSWIQDEWSGQRKSNTVCKGRQEDSSYSFEEPSMALSLLVMRSVNRTAVLMMINNKINNILFICHLHIC